MNEIKRKRADVPALNTASGFAITDDPKANLMAQTLQDNFTENNRPINFNTAIDSDVTNALEKLFLPCPSTPIAPTNPDEIFNYISELKINKSPGIESITNKMIKNFTTKTIIILTYLINKKKFSSLSTFLTTGKLPLFSPLKTFITLKVIGQCL
ncbi:hypothetical protein TNCV_929481 [Trichonephila clavipes]|nr:hypothetical protein TNCV_929481 [Trichonephila clavipes]